MNELHNGGLGRQTEQSRPAPADDLAGCGLCRCGSRTNRRVRFGPVAAGSTVGIAAWAFIYVAGGAAYAACGGDHLTATGAAAILLGLYGGCGACAALFVGAYVAGWCGGGSTRAGGLVYGLILASMANLTLVMTSIALALGMGSDTTGIVASLLAVGAAATGQGTSPAIAMTAMTFVMLLSFLSGGLGGWRGANGPSFPS